MRSYLDAENISRGAEFITDCIRLIRWEGMPASVALPYSPTAAERETTPLTVGRSVVLNDERSAADAGSRSRQLYSVCDVRPH